MSLGHIHTTVPYSLCTLIYFQCLVLYSTWAAPSPHTPVSFSCAPVPVLCSSPLPLPSPPFWPLWHSVPFPNVLCWLWQPSFCSVGVYHYSVDVVGVIVMALCCWLWLRCCVLWVCLWFFKAHYSSSFFYFADEMKKRYILCVQSRLEKEDTGLFTRNEDDLGHNTTKCQDRQFGCLLDEYMKPSVLFPNGLPLQYVISEHSLKIYPSCSFGNKIIKKIPLHIHQSCQALWPDGPNLHNLVIFAFLRHRM